MAASGSPGFAKLGLGMTVGGYRLERELGRGAAGVVFAARHLATGAAVALKVTPGGGSRERFDREVQALAKIQHPNVVGIHEMGETPTFRWYTMDLVEGLPLDKHLAKTPGDRKAVARTFIQIARGMEHAHAKGLVHRDLKPSNVLVTPEGTARVSDFGIAKHLDRATKLTQAGALVGTLHYMSPEQCTDSTSIDARADVWSVGIMLYEATTGTLPWNGDTTIAIISQICGEAPARPRSIDPSIDADLEAIILHALEKAKEDRYASMAELALDLERWLKGETVSASRVTLLRAVVRRVRRRGFVMLSCAAIVLAVAGAVLARSVSKVIAQSSEAAQTDAIRSEADEVERTSARALEKARVALAKSPGEAHDLAATALEERDAFLARVMPPDASPIVSDEAGRARARLEGSVVRTGLVEVEARALLRQGGARAARELLESETREDAELLLELGEARLALGAGEPAAASFRRACELAPDRWEPVLGLAQALASAGRPAEAAPLLEDPRAKRAPRPELAAARAAVLLAQGQAAAALDVVQTALKAEPQSVPLRMARARAVLASGDEKEAITELRVLGEREGLAVREEDRLHLAVGAAPDALRALERLTRSAFADAGIVVEVESLRAATGDVSRAAETLRARLAQLDARPHEQARVLAALVPMEVALTGSPGPILDRLERLAPELAAPTRARVATRLAELPPESLLPRAAGPRAQLLVERARLEAKDAPDRARARVNQALAIEPRSRGALLVRALLEARAGETAAALADRAGALALVAFASGREDALVALDSLRFVQARAAEEVRRALLKTDAASQGVASPALLARAAASLRYAIAADPWIPGARALLARVETARERPQDAVAVAREALAREPLDAAAATALARAAGREDAAEVLALVAPALAVASGAEARDLRDALADLVARAGDFTRAAALTRDVVLAEPVDREALARAIERTRLAGEDTAALTAELARRDAAADASRAVGKEAELASARDQERCFELARRAGEAAPDDVETQALVSAALRKVYRTISDTNGGLRVYDPVRDPAVGVMRDALLDGRLGTETLRHEWGLRPAFGNALIDDWRRRAETSSGRERAALRLALAVHAATQEVFGAEKGALYLEKQVPVRPEHLRVDFADLVALAPHCPTVYAARAVWFGRTGRQASFQFDIDRLRGRHHETILDDWLAAAVQVISGDVESAARTALDAFKLERCAPSDKLLFVTDEPFLKVKDLPAWAPVLAE